MNLYQLRYFYDSARLGSTTEAARANLITQSAVSQAIRSLEDSLGDKLVHHRKNAFELTDAGNLAFSECQSIFEAVDKFKAQLSRAKNVVAGRVSLAATNSIALTALSSTLTKFVKEFSDVEVDLKLGNSDQVKNRLSTRESELGFILEDDEMNGFDSTLINEGKFLLVASPKFKISGIPSKVIITRQNKIEVRHLQKKLGSGLKFSMEVFSWELIRQLCVDGAGVGYLPDYLVHDDVKAKRLKVILPDLKTWKYKLVAIHLKGRTLSFNAQTFLDRVIGP